MASRIWEIVLDFVKSHCWEIAFALVFALIMVWIFKMNDRISDCIHKHFPAKLKVEEMNYVHFERIDISYDSKPRYHDYSFMGKVFIKPRAKAVFVARYLEMTLRDGSVLKVDYVSPPPEFDYLNRPIIVPPEITPGHTINDTYVFRLRIPKAITVPPYGYVVLEFNHGHRCKEKVNIILQREEHLTEDGR